MTTMNLEEIKAAVSEALACTDKEYQLVEVCRTVQELEQTTADRYKKALELIAEKCGGSGDDCACSVAKKALHESQEPRGPK